MTTATEKKKGARLSRFLARYQDGPKSLERSKLICCFLFVLIPIIHFFVFYIGGNYYSFFLAFTEFDGYDASYNEIYRASLGNFRKVWEMVTNADSGLRIAFRNTMVLFVVHFLQLCFNFLIAYAFTRKLRGSKFFRVALYLPRALYAVVFSHIRRRDTPLLRC